MAEIIPLVVASDANYFYGLQTSVASAIAHETTYTLNVHLLDGGLHDWQWNALNATATRINPRTVMTRHLVSSELLDSFHVSKGMTSSAYARLITTMFVPDSYAIYVDSDFLVTHPVSELLPYLKSGKAVAASQQGDEMLPKDCPFSDDPDLGRYKYINSGLLLLNLEKWREQQLTERLLAFLQKESARCLYFDQTALNWLLKDDIEILPLSWNTVTNDYDWGVRPAQPGHCNLHYATGMKPWNRPLPMLSHEVWWLFNRTFPTAAMPPNPFRQLKNVGRYARMWLGQHVPGGDKRRSQGSLRDWEAFWNPTRRSEMIRK
jgi:lipopolysaccharide biosynthesis glycosyltransferase